MSVEIINPEIFEYIYSNINEATLKYRLPGVPNKSDLKHFVKELSRTNHRTFEARYNELTGSLLEFIRWNKNHEFSAGKLLKVMEYVNYHCDEKHCEDRSLQQLRCIINSLQKALIESLCEDYKQSRWGEI